MGKRVLLFVATNIAILVTVSIIMAVLNATGLIDTSAGLSHGALMVFCLVWGMGASLVSLALSRKIAKWSMGIKLVNGQTGNADLDWLHNTVGNLSRQANLPMPEVGFYESPEVNAFATGPSKNRSLVAVSTGLLQKMNRNEVEAVLGHEISHVANGDMVTMTLIQGVVNAFVLYLSHIVAGIARSFLSRDSDRGPNFLAVMAGHVVFIAAQIAFGILGSMITGWYSRQREFRADAGGAQLAGRQNMIGALRRLMSTQQLVDTQHAQLATLKIAGVKGFMALVSTHPPLEVRIAALERVG
ncbi:MAG TPA: protease HtpX [Vicinamibacteria bacterium]